MNVYSSGRRLLHENVIPVDDMLPETAYPKLLWAVGQSGEYDEIAHGAGLAVMSPAWMKFVYKHDVNRFAQFAVRVWGCDMNFASPEATALEGIHRFEIFLKSIGMPITFAELGAKEEDIPAMVAQLCKRASIGNFVKIGAKEAEAIFRLAL